MCPSHFCYRRVIVDAVGGDKFIAVKRTRKAWRLGSRKKRNSKEEYEDMQGKEELGIKRMPGCSM